VFPISGGVSRALRTPIATGQTDFEPYLHNKSPLCPALITARASQFRGSSIPNDPTLRTSPNTPATAKAPEMHLTQDTIHAMYSGMVLCMQCRQPFTQSTRTDDTPPPTCQTKLNLTDALCQGSNPYFRATRGDPLDHIMRW